jgi:hypothetical protein
MDVYAVEQGTGNVFLIFGHYGRGRFPAYPVNSM